MKEEKAILLYLDMHIYEETKRDDWLSQTHKRLASIAKEAYFLSRTHTPSHPDIQCLAFTTGEQWLQWLGAFPPHTQVILVPAYAPLIQPTLVEEALNTQIKHRFDYTYAELPHGLMGEIIDTSIAPFILRALPEGTKLFEKSLKEWLGQDLSSYDCNILYTDTRLLEYRLSFTPENTYQSAVLEKIVSSGEDFSSLDSLKTWIENHPSLLRYTPTYIEIELATMHESSGPFAPDFPRSGEMPTSNLSQLLRIFDTFAPDAVMSLGLYGEVFAYEEWDVLIEEVRQRPQRRFIMESRSIVSRPERVEAATALPNVDIIFDVSTVSTELFSQWKKPKHPFFPFDGLNNIEFLHTLSRKDRVYIQMTRTPENDKELMRFYEVWKDFSSRIIIRKPDSFGGTNLCHRVVDLSPVKRSACLPLQRNLVVFCDGTVPLCRQDHLGKYSAGNVFVDGIENCWDRLSNAYQNQFSHSGISTPLCESCDDWWIFSF